MSLFWKIQQIYKVIKFTKFKVFPKKGKFTTMRAFILALGSKVEIKSTNKNKTNSKLLHKSGIRLQNSVK